MEPQVEPQVEPQRQQWTVEQLERLERLEQLERLVAQQSGATVDWNAVGSQLGRSGSACRMRALRLWRASEKHTSALQPFGSDESGAKPKRADGDGDSDMTEEPAPKRAAKKKRPLNDDGQKRGQQQPSNDATVEKKRGLQERPFDATSVAPSAKAKPKAKSAGKRKHAALAVSEDKVSYRVDPNPPAQPWNASYKNMHNAYGRLEPEEHARLHAACRVIAASNEQETGGVVQRKSNGIGAPRLRDVVNQDQPEDDVIPAMAIKYWVKAYQPKPARSS